MKVWSLVVLLLKRELSSLSLCLLDCNLVVLLVVMEWTGTITGDCMVFSVFFSSKKNLGRPFTRAGILPQFIVLLTIAYKA